MSEKVVFKQGENEKTITVALCASHEHKEETPETADGDSDREPLDLMFRVLIENPEPQVVKLSRKNVAFITINNSDDIDAEQKENQQLLMFFMNSKNPSWASQFKNAIMLGPTIEDDMEIDHVELMEAIMHFVCIFWKLLFAIVPPV